MARFPKKKGSNEEQIFFSDNLTQSDKEQLSKAFGEKNTDVKKAIENITSHGLSVKISWSDYNDSFSCTVSPVERDHPSHGTFYSAFHANWEKAVFVCDYLLRDRYDYGDWTKDKAKRFDNDW